MKEKYILVTVKSTK